MAKVEYWKIWCCCCFCSPIDTTWEKCILRKWYLEVPNFYINLFTKRLISAITKHAFTKIMLYVLKQLFAHKIDNFCIMLCLYDAISHDTHFFSVSQRLRSVINAIGYFFFWCPVNAPHAHATQQFLFYVSSYYSNRCISFMTLILHGPTSRQSWRWPHYFSRSWMKLVLSVFIKCKSTHCIVHLITKPCTLKVVKCWY